MIQHLTSQVACNCVKEALMMLSYVMHEHTTHHTSQLTNYEQKMRSSPQTKRWSQNMKQANQPQERKRGEASAGAATRPMETPVAVLSSTSLRFLRCSSSQLVGESKRIWGFSAGKPTKDESPASPLVMIPRHGGSCWRDHLPKR